MDAEVQHLLTDIHAYVDRSPALLRNCHGDSSLLDSSSKLIRLFELRIGSVQRPRLLSVLTTCRSSDY